LVSNQSPAAARLWTDWLQQVGETEAAASGVTDLSNTPVGVEQELIGPVGERNMYATEARGDVLCVAAERRDLLRQIGVALATGNRAMIGAGALDGMPARPPPLAAWVQEISNQHREDADAVLFSGTEAALLAFGLTEADKTGPIVAIHTAQPDGSYPMEWLVRERSVSINTAAAGGNANLMMIG
jgi:RHH-type proline utilization regulon transcriptional repressor/proline dehydrogenase/delta 1-pyrroline-5-carboxylate dehydrogenase